MNLINISKITILVLLLSFHLPSYSNSVANSGTDCGDAKEPTYDVEKHKSNVNSMAIKLFTYLEENAQQMAIVSRAGSDLSENKFKFPKEQTFSHAGIAWKSTEDGKWRFKHLLNVCAGDEGKIFVQSLATFFTDEPFYYDVKVAVPSLELQEKTVAVLESNLANKMLNSNYSSIANPFNTEFQNSNMWVLTILATAQGGTNTRMDAQEFYKNNGFTPSKVKVGRWKGLFAGFIANATLDDHTRKEKKKKWYNFVSAASLYDYINRTDEPVAVDVLCHDAGCNVPVSSLE